MLKFLIETFKATKGRMPNNMEMILLRQKAAKQSIDERKVVNIFDRSTVNPNKPIMGGKNIPETEEDIRRRLMKQNEEGIASMKSKLEDPEKKAMGGRIGYKSGTDLLEQAGNLFFPEGDLQNIKATAPDQRTYNIEATKDMVENLPGGLLKDIVAPAGALVMSPFYDGIQAATRMTEADINRAMQTGALTPREIASEAYGLAFDRENPINSAIERFTGAAAPLADRFTTKETPTTDSTNRNLFTQVGYEEDPYAGIEGQTALLDPVSLIIGGGKIIKGAKASTIAKQFLKNKARQKVGKTIFDKVQKKINPPKYPQGPSNIKTGGGGRDIGGNRNVGGGNTAKNSLGQTAAQATKAGTGTSQGYSQHYADGGRIGYKLGTGKKGVEGLLNLIKNKFGKKSITTADKASTPQKTLDRDMFKKADENFKNKRMLDDDEYQDFLDEVGGADQLEAYDFDGTVGDAKRIIREQKQYMDDIELEYKKGNLDPEPGDKSPARKRFLEKKLEEMEASGDKRLMTPDEIDELSTFDMGTELEGLRSLGANKLAERFELKQRFPGLDDTLIDRILVDDNTQRKAEVLATIEESYKMLEKGMDPGDIIETFKNTSRRKNAQGGLNYLMGL